MVKKSIAHSFPEGFAPRWTWRSTLWAAMVTLFLFGLLPGLERLSDPPPATLSLRTVEPVFRPPRFSPPLPRPEPSEPLRSLVSEAVPRLQVPSASRPPAPLARDREWRLDPDAFAGAFQSSAGWHGEWDVRSPDTPELTLRDLDTPPRALVRREPVYPPDARVRGEEGFVTVAFTVTEDGRVRDLEVLASEPPGRFDRAATDAILRWRFSPGERARRPVAVRVEQRVTFRLDQ